MLGLGGPLTLPLGAAACPWKLALRARRRSLGPPRGPRSPHLVHRFPRLPTPHAPCCSVFIRERPAPSPCPQGGRCQSGLWSPCLVALWMNPLFAANLWCFSVWACCPWGKKINPGSLTNVKPLLHSTPYSQPPHRLLTTKGLSLTPCNRESSRRPRPPFSRFWTGSGGKGY